MPLWDGLQKTGRDVSIEARSNAAVAKDDVAYSDSKYDDIGFVSTFIARQYGGLLSYEEEAVHVHGVRFRGRMAEVYAGCELFYQSLITLAVPHLNAGSVVLDVGCGAGRLTGELARRSCSCVGVDYSPQMIRAATSVILQSSAEEIILRLPFSRVVKRQGRLRGWGLSNCAFIIGDCQSLPFREGSFERHFLCEPPSSHSQPEESSRRGSKST